MDKQTPFPWLMGEQHEWIRDLFTYHHANNNSNDNYYVLGADCVPGTVLGTLCVLNIQCIFTRPCVVLCAFLSLQRRKLRHRETQ